MKILKSITLLFFATSLFVSCSDDDNVSSVTPTGETKSYQLFERSASGVSGTATFAEQTDGSVLVVLNVTGTPDDGVHPSHIHFNTAAEGGDIAVSLQSVDGATGMSETVVTETTDGTPLSYESLLDFDGYINIHLSADELGTVVAQGDIGQNELTGMTKSYALGEVAVPGISGSVLFEERVNGEAQATIMLSGTPDDGMHPAHIHENTAAEGGDILYTFSVVDGSTGMSRSNVAELADGTPFGYDDVLVADAYVNVHLSADQLQTVVAQGDIGQNELTGESKSFTLFEKDDPNIDGTVLFEERVNGEAQATIMLSGTYEGGMHPAHIHAGTTIDNGAIIFTFDPVDGSTGMSVTNVSELADETAFGYSDVLTVDGYVNVHLSADELGTLVAQGDIGQNELTGESMSYVLEERQVPGISGSVIFEERANGTAIATLMIDGTPDDGMHPTHIHENSFQEGGDIIFTFEPVNGLTGMSQTNVETLNNNTTFLYEDVLTVDGYINVHLSANDLATIVAQGNIGSNAM